MGTRFDTWRMEGIRVIKWGIFRATNLYRRNEINENMTLEELGFEINVGSEDPVSRGTCWAICGETSKAIGAQTGIPLTRPKTRKQLNNENRIEDK